jgi:tetratricopeptide (TPR) repeat protein
MNPLMTFALRAHPVRIMLIFMISSMCAVTSFSQTGFERYFTESLLPTIDNSKYQNIKFEWTIPGKLQTSMNEGLTEMDAGNFKAAMLDFDVVLKQEPNFWPAYYYRGVSRKALHEFDSAVIDLQSALKYNAKISEAHIAIGECHLTRDIIDKAIRSFETAVEIQPDALLGYYDLGIAEFHFGNPRKALKYFQKCNELNADYAPAYFMLAVLSIKENGKKNSASLSYLNKALQVDSIYREALFWRGLLYASQEKPEKCLQDWDKLVRYNPNATFFLLLRGFLHIELGDFDRAFNDLRKAVLSRSLDEDKFVGGQTLLDKQIDIYNAANYAMRFSYGLDEAALSYFKKGFCYFLSGSRAKARFNFKQAATIQPSATVFYLQALNYEHMGIHDTAFVFYDKALALDNDIFDAHKKRGIYRFEVQNWKGAYQDFNDMIRLQPEANVTYRLRGYVKSHQKDYYGAIVDLSRFAKSDSSDAEVYKTRAYCRAEVGDQKGRVEDYIKVLELDWDKNIVKEVIIGYAALGDTINALNAIKRYGKFNLTNHYDRVVQIELFIDMHYWKYADKEIDQAFAVTTEAFRRSELFLLKGINYAQQNKHEKAVNYFNDALRLHKDNLEALYYRGKSFIALNRKDEALDDFRVLKNAGFSDSKEIFETLKTKP